MKQFRFTKYSLLIFFLASSMSLVAQKKVKVSIESDFRDKSVDFGLGVKGKLEEQAVLLVPNTVSIRIDNKKMPFSTRIFLNPGKHSLKLRTFYKNVQTHAESELVSSFEKGKFYIIKPVQSNDKQSVSYSVNEISNLEYNDIIKNLNTPKSLLKYDNDVQLEISGKGEVTDFFGEKETYAYASFLSPKLSPNNKLLAVPFSYNESGRGSFNMLAILNYTTKDILEIVVPRGEPFTDFDWINNSTILYNFRNYRKETAAIKLIDLKDNSYTPETLLDVSHISSSLYDPPAIDSLRNAIYFSTYNKKGKKDEIYSYNTKTKSLKKLLNGEFPVISLSKNKLFYLENNNFYVFDFENKKSNELTNFSNLIKKYKLVSIDHPSLSPKGNKIVFSAYLTKGEKKRRYSIFVMNSNGTEISELIYSNNNQLKNPEWLTDNTICFEVKNMMRRQIFQFKFVE